MLLCNLARRHPVGLLTRPAMKFCRTACRKSRVDAAIRSSSLCPPLLQHTPQCQQNKVTGSFHHVVGSCRHLHDGCQFQGRLYVVAMVPLVLGICCPWCEDICGAYVGAVPLDKPQWRAKKWNAYLEDEGRLSVSGLTPAAESKALSVLA